MKSLEPQRALRGKQRTQKVHSEKLLTEVLSVLCGFLCGLSG